MWEQEEFDTWFFFFFQFHIFRLFLCLVIKTMLFKISPFQFLQVVSVTSHSLCYQWCLQIQFSLSLTLNFFRPAKTLKPCWLMLEERKEKRKRSGCQLFLKIWIFIFISQHTFLLIVLLGASWNCIHLPWVYCYTVGINFNLKKADWYLFTYFTEPLCLQLKIFLSCSVWDDEAWVS